MVPRKEKPKTSCKTPERVSWVGLLLGVLHDTTRTQQEVRVRFHRVTAQDALASPQPRTAASHCPPIIFTCIWPHVTLISDALSTKGYLVMWHAHNIIACIKECLDQKQRVADGWTAFHVIIRVIKSVGQWGTQISCHISRPKNKSIS